MESQSPSRSSQKARGTCSVCRSERQLHNKDGRVHLHGPRAQPCPGSHKPPLETIRRSSVNERTEWTDQGLLDRGSSEAARPRLQSLPASAELSAADPVEDVSRTEDD